MLYRFLSVAITIMLLPLIVPLGLYIGLKYHWRDTVPSDDDLQYGGDE